MVIARLCPLFDKNPILAGDEVAVILGEDAAAGADNAPDIHAPLEEDDEEADAIGEVGMVLGEAEDEEAGALPAAAPAEVAGNEEVGVAVAMRVWEQLVLPQARNP